MELALSILFILIWNANGHNSTGLCPIGYWPADVNISSGEYGTDRKFQLPFIHESREQICQFCPHVGCYVVKYEIVEESKSQKKKKENKSPVKQQTVFNSTTSNYTSLNNTNSEPAKKKYNYYASCSSWHDLPPPEDIVSYLDCVMIGGQEDQYYLFIYEPRFQISRVPVVDCVDMNFLDWIPEGTRLLGLELGFRMRAIPPYLFRYKQQLMQLTQYICIDGSSLIDQSIPFDDTERFASNQLKQVVFRTTSLLRNRRPPVAHDERYNLSFQSDEKVEPCPLIVQHKPANITSDCQFLPTALPTTSDKVDIGKAEQRCPFNKKRGKLDKKGHRKHERSAVKSNYDMEVLLNVCLLVVVSLITGGMIVAFCIINAEKLMLCRTKARKRREREAAIAMELAEQAAKEQAAALEAEERRQNAWHPIYGRYGVPPAMGGAFGAFAARTLDVSNVQPNAMGGST